MAVAPPAWARVVYADLPMWLLKVLARPVLARLVGVPSGFRCSAEDDRVVSDLIDSVFPVAPRVAGINFDAYVSNPDVNGYPLEQIRVPTLLVHAKDDPLTSYDAAQRAAERIPGAVLVTMESGGHLGLGQTERTRSEIAKILAAKDSASAVRPEKPGDPSGPGDERAVVAP
jgi:pimeloyl-ACP methyl ester carboxylesterase